MSPVKNAIGAGGARHDGGLKGLGRAGLGSTSTRKVLPLPREGPGLPLALAAIALLRTLARHGWPER